MLKLYCIMYGVRLIRYAYPTLMLGAGGTGFPNANGGAPPAIEGFWKITVFCPAGEVCVRIFHGGELMYPIVHTPGYKTSWNIPKPARMYVLWSLNGSYAKPLRGS